MAKAFVNHSKVEEKNQLNTASAKENHVNVKTSRKLEQFKGR